MSQINQSLDWLLSHGSTAYVAGLFRSGMGTQDVWARLNDRFRLATARTLEAAFNRGVSAYEAANRLNAMAGPSRLLARDVPSGPAGATGYLYSGDVVWADPNTGATTRRTFQYLSPANLTHNEIADAMRSTAEMYYAAGLRQEGSKEFSRQGMTVGLDLFAVERA